MSRVVCKAYINGYFCSVLVRDEDLNIVLSDSAILYLALPNIFLEHILAHRCLQQSGIRAPKAYA